MKKTYLAVFLLPKPRREHAQIVDVINHASGGDYKSAFVGSNCIGYLFNTELELWQISFSTILLNDDSFLIIEAGQDFSHQNLRVAENWLKSHHQPA